MDGHPAFAAVGAASCGAPRILPIVIALPNRLRAAVAPSATVSGGRISSRSCSIHQRQALDLALRRASGGCRRLPRSTNLKCLTALVT